MMETVIRRTEVLLAIKGIISTLCDLSVPWMQSAHRLRDNLAIDEFLDLPEIASAVQREFEVRIPFGEYERFETVADIVNLVIRLARADGSRVIVSRQGVLEEIAGILQVTIGHFEPIAVTPRQYLQHDVGLSFTQQRHLIPERLNRHFAIEIAEDACLEVHTVGNACDLVIAALEQDRFKIVD